MFFSIRFLKRSLPVLCEVTRKVSQNADRKVSGTALRKASQKASRGGLSFVLSDFGDMQTNITNMPKLIRE